MDERHAERQGPQLASKRITLSTSTSGLRTFLRKLMHDESTVWGGWIVHDVWDDGGDAANLYINLGGSLGLVSLWLIELDDNRVCLDMQCPDKDADVLTDLYTRLVDRLEDTGWLGNADNKDTSAPSGPPHKVKGGRPRQKVDEWARRQVHELGRDKAEVYLEWVEKGGKRVASLTNPRDSFNHFIKSPPMKK